MIYTDEDKIIETLLNAKDYKSNPMFTQMECDSFITDANLRNKIILLVKTYKVEYPSYVIIGAIASALKRNKGINAFFEYDATKEEYTDVISSHDANHYFKKYRKHHRDDEKEREFLLQGEAPVMGGKSRRRRSSRRHRRSPRGANKKSRKVRKSHKVRKSRRSR